MASFTAGTTFTDGVANDVTAAKLAALVNAATPTSGFIQDRTSESAIASNDTLLFGDASASDDLKRITVSNLFKTDVSITSATGTAGTVAIGPTGDTNTGIFFPAADTIAFSEGGAEAMRINSSGNVGIGTTSPFSKLHVKDGTNRNFFVVSDVNYGNINGIAVIGANDANNAHTPISFACSPLILNAAGGGGNVGIGESSPTSKLEIATASTTAYGLISRTPVVGLTAGDYVNMAYFSDSRGDQNDGLRIVNIRDSTGTAIGDWPTSSFRIRRSVDQNNAASGVQEEIVFGSNLLAFHTAGTERLRIDSSGKVCVGRTSGDGTFNTEGSVYFYSFTAGVGNSTIKYDSATGQLFYDTSSLRYKKNIRDSSYGLDSVTKMRSVQYEYKDSNHSDVGIIAEELEAIIPELVGKNADGQPESVLYDRLTSVLIKAVQELKAENDSLKLRIEALEAK